jgi:hypothetical protein
MPTLRREAESELAQLYEKRATWPRGRCATMTETAAADALTAACPYGPDQITGVGLPK